MSQRQSRRVITFLECRYCCKQTFYGNLFRIGAIIQWAMSTKKNRSLSNPLVLLDGDCLTSLEHRKAPLALGILLHLPLAPCHLPSSCSTDTLLLALLPSPSSLSRLSLLPLLHFSPPWYLETGGSAQGEKLKEAHHKNIRQIITVFFPACEVDIPMIARRHNEVHAYLNAN